MEQLKTEIKNQVDKIHNMNVLYLINDFICNINKSKRKGEK